MFQLSKTQEERALRLHEESTVIIIHEDVMSIDVAERRSRGEKNVIGTRHLPLLREGGVDAVIGTVGGTSLHATFPLKSLVSSGSHPLKRTLELIDGMVTDANEAPEDLFLATRAEDTGKARDQGKLAIYFGIEGGDPIDELYVIRTLYRLGVRCVEPAWLYRNLMMDGSWERTAGDLTTFGVEAIHEMNELGILIDTSHATEKGFYDILEFSSQPSIASHSNARAICNHPRNLSDDQLRAIASKDGVVGINLNFTSKSPTPDHWELAGTLEDLLDHVDYIAKLIGVEYIGLGLDLNEKARFPSEIYTEIWDGTIYSFEFEYPAGLQSISELSNFTRGLVSRGYSDESIRKILGENFQRVLRTVLK